MSESEKSVHQRIGKAYVKLMADKIAEIERDQQKVIESLTKLLGEQFGELLATDIDKARSFIYELSHTVDIYREVVHRFRDFKEMLKKVVERYE